MSARPTNPPSLINQELEAATRAAHSGDLPAARAATKAALRAINRAIYAAQRAARNAEAAA